jgi:hypothetical protein
LPRVIAAHDVKDVQHWLSAPGREEYFGPLGVTKIQPYVDPAAVACRGVAALSGLFLTGRMVIAMVASCFRRGRLPMRRSSYWLLRLRR